GEIPSAFMLLAAFCEPVLIASLSILCLARRALHALGYVPSLIAIAAVEVALAWTSASLGSNLLPGRATFSFVQIGLLTLFVTGSVLAYFDLLARALSPAIAEA